ncbi:hypothetical protein I6F07_17310 [Ensifer sp. IC4062]|nr:hypothetical protein [Ensifer sp. IC4062]MCA1441940.1 hypothetical protein [Ensifer sp. IC4062]
MGRFSSGAAVADFDFLGRIETGCFVKELRPASELALRQMKSQLGPHPKSAIERYIATLERAGVPVAELVGVDFDRDPPLFVQRRVNHPTLSEVLLDEFRSPRPVPARSLGFLSLILEYITSVAFEDPDIRIDSSASNFAVIGKSQPLVLLDVIPPWRLSMRSREETDAEAVLGRLTFEWTEQISDLLCEWLRPLVSLEYSTDRLRTILADLMPRLEAMFQQAVSRLNPFGAVVPSIPMGSFDVWSENRAFRRFNLFRAFMSYEISRTELFDIFRKTSTKYVI